MATVSALSRRERDIAGLVAAGLSNGQIARALYLEEQTVKNHLTNIYRKLGFDGAHGVQRRVRLTLAVQWAGDA